jgi:hypothetical protein
MVKQRRGDREMKDDWANRPRISKIAGAMYPGLLDAQTRSEMLNANSEQSAGLQRRMNEGDKLYNKPTTTLYNVSPSMVHMIRMRLIPKQLVEKKTTKSWWEK